MGLLTKEQIRELIKERNIKTTSDISAMLKDLFSETMQEMLETEMDTTLGYGKNENSAKQTDNRRNGHSKKTVVSEYGDTELLIPRDREGEHEPLIVRKHQKNLTGIEEQIIALYSKGMTVRDVQDHLNQLYGITVSPTLISNVTNKLMPLIKEWQSRPLEKTYAVVFLDAIHYKVRQEGAIVNKASYMVIGIDLDGRKDVLGMWIGEHETSKFWLVVLNELKNRGVQDVLICCVDNLKGFNEAIGACFPEAEIQKCIVHQIRNSIRYVSYKDVKKVLADLKPVYTAASEPLALEFLESFETIWGNKYPLIVNSWRANWSELSTFFKYPPEIRKIIYTTNMIESYHRQLRKVTKGKSIFPNDESLQKMLYLATMDVLRKWTGRVQNWGQILLQLSVFFPDKVKSALS
ncbi:IS256 family transposase [Pectinatus frisingensis]|uniref:IS256 family transposase n=1 Tax=Pectinatus frisingensis TaxID=865 RepID=UPI0018C75C29|nr:IS256 family transposase [Pectinatus frisingensis]